MSKLGKIISIIIGRDSAEKSHLTGSSAAMSNRAETFVHCGCMDGDKIYDVSVMESFGAAGVKRKLCMFHIEAETEKGKIVSFD